MSVEIEDIILNKEFFELTEEERTLVSEMAADEDEFEAIKWTLSQTRNEFQTSQIIPSGELRSKVMAHLEDSDRKKVLWLNSFGAFMLPKEKSFFQKPAIQIGIAAVLILGVLTLLQFDLNETNIALNDQKDEVQIEEQQKIQDEEQESFQPAASTEEKEMEVELFNQEELQEVNEVNPANFDMEERSVKKDEIEDAAANGKRAMEDLKFVENSSANRQAPPALSAPTAAKTTSPEYSSDDMTVIADEDNLAEEIVEVESQTAPAQLEEVSSTARKDKLNSFANISRKEKKAVSADNNALGSSGYKGETDLKSSISILNSNELKSLFLTYN